MLLALEEIAPELTPYCRLAYAEATVLQFGKLKLLFQVGPQQGDPLGPLLFCLPVIQSVIRAPYSPVVCPSELVYMLLTELVLCFNSWRYAPRKYYTL